ncbi:carbohydrate binding family 9 domain-containing protein, partial [bacterium]|nr:carbohydrate binding family 9 domain-containing protein [bacterium]
MFKKIIPYSFLLVFISSFSFVYSQKSVRAFKVQTPPVIDGFVQEEAWQVADSATDFVQMEPTKGASASENTVVYITYDNEKLYFGIKCYARDPSSIVGKIQTRDVLSKNDDQIGILLDTYNDNRSAMGFFVNPLGVQIDMKVTDDGRNHDLNWDAEWESAVVRTSDGWSAEIAIPFQSITYNKNLSTWGVNFGRVIRNNSETAYWSGVLNDDFRISQGGLLQGIQSPGKKKIVELTPNLTLRYENSDETEVHSKVLPQVGIDAHLNISSNVVSHLTYNPDFATVEGDQEQINMTRWELSFPEKRLFFLEGNELFKTRIKTFYSRRVGDIQWGAKINGK